MKRNGLDFPRVVINAEGGWPTCMHVPLMWTESVHDSMAFGGAAMMNRTVEARREHHANLLKVAFRFPCSSTPVLPLLIQCRQSKIDGHISLLHVAFTLPDPALVLGGVASPVDTLKPTVAAKGGLFDFSQGVDVHCRDTGCDMVVRTHVEANPSRSPVGECGWCVRHFTGLTQFGGGRVAEEHRSCRVDATFVGEPRFSNVQ